MRLKSLEALKIMSAPATKFTPEQIAIAEIASVIISQPVNLVQKMTYNVACKHAYHLLVSAQQFLEQRDALIASGKVAEEPQQPSRAETFKRSVRPSDIIPPAVRVAE
jgi:hypothetical protein